MKIVLALMLSLSSFSALAVEETTLFCTRNKSGPSCGPRTIEAFEKLGCKPVTGSLDCLQAEGHPQIDPAEVDSVRGKDLCTIKSECHEPHNGNFGQVDCSWNRPNETKLNLKSVDPGLTMTTSVGLFRRYVTTLCK